MANPRQAEPAEEAPPTIIREIIRAEPVTPTALADRIRPPGQVTLQFRKTTAHGATQYGRGVCAGFSAAEAERLVAARSAIVVSDRDLANFYVTK